MTAALTNDEIKALRALATATEWAVEDDTTQNVCTTYRRVGVLKTTLARLLDIAEDHARTQRAHDEVMAEQGRLRREIAVLKGGAP